MFIVKKEIHGKDYFYLRESKRIDGKVVAKTIAYLGKTKKQAEEKKKEFEMKGEKGAHPKSSPGVVQPTLNKNERNIKEKSKSNVMEQESKKELSIEDLAMFCKRKGFVYASGEIYGGLAGFWDFGHLGVELKNNLKQAWWKFHVQQRKDMAGIDGAIVTNPNVWKASGHVDSFVDIAVVCKKCKNKTKIDKHELGKAKCGKCGGEFEDKGEFNPMFTTQVGPIKEDSVISYLRPETAQLIFADFKLVQENARLKLPFGIAQIGKAFRNELSPREFLFRCREFEQMEIEYFIAKGMKCPYVAGIKNEKILIYSSEMQEKEKEPEEMKIYDAWKKGIIKTDWHAYWIALELSWFKSLGANSKKFRARQHLSDEKSHYATDTWDLEYDFPMGWRELQGFANRSNYDLSQHEKFSGKSMEIVNDEKKVLADVVCEPSLGVERAFLVFMFDAYSFDDKRQNIVLKLHPKLAPIKVAILPIVKNDKQVVKIAQEIYKNLGEEWNVLYDESASLGRRYSRNDEIGTPYCITIDNDSEKDKSATIRDRDSTKQIRVKIENLKDVLRKLLNQELEFEKAGKLVETRKG